MSYTNVWSDLTPLGSAAANTIDNIFRSLKVDIEQRFMDIWDMPSFATDPLRPYNMKFSTVPTNNDFIPGAASGFRFRNIANDATNLGITDAGVVTVRAGIVISTGGITVTGNSAVTGTLAVSSNLTVTGVTTLAGTTGAVNLKIIGNGTADRLRILNNAATFGVTIDSTNAVESANAPLNIQATLITTSGNLVSNNSLTVVSGGIAATGNSTITGTLGISSTLTVAGAAAIGGAIASYNFRVIGTGTADRLRVVNYDAGTGVQINAVNSAETLDAILTLVGSNIILSGAITSINSFTVSSGGIAITGNSTITGTLGVSSNFTINTNKFTVTASSGNTIVAGTLGVTGLTTLNELVVQGPFTTNVVAILGDDVYVAGSGKKIAFYNGTLTGQQTVTGSRGGNAALASLLTKLATFGLIIDSSS